MRKFFTTWLELRKANSFFHQSNGKMQDNIFCSDSGLGAPKEFKL
jgi:hypothetical protein